MVYGSKACELFSKLLLGWEMCSVDADGQSGGIFSTWNPKNVKLVPYLLYTKILHVIHLMNYYDPILIVRYFWEMVVEDGIIDLPNFILGDDLNFIDVSSIEVWGYRSRVDPLGMFFKQLF